MDLDNILTHLGEDRENYFHAVAPPIIQTSNFVFPDLGSFRERFRSEYDNHVYSRGNNPTVRQLREKVAALEETEDCLVFSSGAAAVAAAVLSQVKQGDHVICVDKPYSWTRHLFSDFLPRFGVSCTYVDSSAETIDSHVFRPNTRMVYLESPNSLTFELQDIAAIARQAKERGIVTAIDNSYSSPIFQRPSTLGIDLVIHSATKYLNGHSDVVMGVVCGSRKHCEEIFSSAYMCLGAVATAQSAALALRGLRTLRLRMERSDASSRLLAERLRKHPKVDEVFHPMLSNFPQADLAARQMSGSGGLFTIRLASQDRSEIEAFVERIERFLMAVSWGGYESLMMPMVAFYDIPGRADTELPYNLVRFYVGLEDPEWLWEDLERALDMFP